MSQVSQSQYLWVAKTSGNLDIEVLKEVSRRVTLELDEPDPLLQKRESRQQQDQKDSSSGKNEKIVIKGILWL